MNAIDLTGIAGDHDTARNLEIEAAENLKRVLRARRPTEPDWTLEPGLERLTTFLETKTVWHPVGDLTAAVPAPTGGCADRHRTARLDATAESR